jgi:hypothetical protein
MGKARLIKTRHQSIPQNPKAKDSHDPDFGNSESIISKKTEKKKITEITNNEFTTSERNIKPTEDGMRLETKDSLLTNGHGRVMNEVGGKCNICKKYYPKEKLHTCSVAGCENQVVCDKCIREFKGRKYCAPCFPSIVNNHDAWAEAKNKKNLRDKNEQ